VDLALSEEQELAVATLRRFVRKEIWLWEKRIDSDAVSLPHEACDALLPKSQASGLDNLIAAPGFCGPDLDEAAPDLLTRVRVAEEMSQHRAGVVAPSYELFGVDAPPQLFAATEAQQERFLWPLLRREARAFAGLSDPTGAGQPLDGTRIRARRVGGSAGAGEWMLDGTKLFVVGAETADFGLVFANTEDEDGTARGVSLFVVEATREGFQRWRPYRTLSPGRDVMELNLSNLRLPAENLIGGVGGGAVVGESFLTRRRVFQAAQLTGVASAAQDMARGQAHARREFDAPIAAQQGVQWALADNEVELRASRWLYLAAAQSLDAGSDGADAEVAGARLMAGSTATAVVDRTIQLHGSAGVSADLPLERWYRDLRLSHIDEGGEAAQRSTIANHLLTTFKK
jgi:acyl-CoA dehydrogenase